MRNVSGRIQDIRQLTSMLLKLSADAWRFRVLCLRSTPILYVFMMELSVIMESLRSRTAAD